MKKYKKRIMVAALLGLTALGCLSAAAAPVTGGGEDGTVFYDVREENPFALYGFCADGSDGLFRRMPEAAAAETTGNSRLDVHSVYTKTRETSGGRIRFRTNSKKITVRVELPDISTGNISNFNPTDMPLAARLGFDVYTDSESGSEYFATLMPESGILSETGPVTWEDTAEFPSAETRDVTLYFPLLNAVKNVWVGLDAGAELSGNGRPYRDMPPVVLYGSSIEQGGKVSHPGATYISQISRGLNVDFVNLGVWGSARGEERFAEYIATLNMSAFVMNYDHNSSLSELKARYETFYETVRAAGPDIPIVITSAPDKSYTDLDERAEFIKSEYEKFRARGDNVYYIDGRSVFSGYAMADCVIDGVHPSDLGNTLLAESVGAVLKSVLFGDSNEPADLYVPPVILCEKGGAPSFRLEADFGAADRRIVESSDTEVEISEFDASNSGEYPVTVNYRGLTRESTVYVVSDISKAYYDDFSANSGKMANWTGKGFSIDAGLGMLKGVDGGRIYLNIPGSSEWTDYIVEADVTAVNADADKEGSSLWALAARMHGADNLQSYEAGFGLGNMRADIGAKAESSVRFYARGAALQDAEKLTDKFNPVYGGNYKLRLEVTGDRVKAFIKPDGGDWTLIDAAGEREKPSYPGNGGFAKGTVGFHIASSAGSDGTKHYTLWDNLLVLPTESEPEVTGIAAKPQVVNAGTPAEELDFNIRVDLNGFYLPEWIPANGAGVTLTGYDPNAVGTQNVTAEYAGKKTEVPITVSRDTVLAYDDFFHTATGTVATGYGNYNINGGYIISGGSLYMGRNSSHLLRQYNSPDKENPFRFRETATVSATLRVPDSEVSQLPPGRLSAADLSAQHTYAFYGVYKLKENTQNKIFTAFGAAFTRSDAKLVLIYVNASDDVARKYNVLSIADWPVAEVSKNRGFTLRVYGETVKGYIDGAQVAEYTFDLNDADDKAMYDDIHANGRYGICHNTLFGGFVSREFWVNCVAESLLFAETPALYAVTADENTENGALKVVQKHAFEGDRVSVGALPDEGWFLKPGFPVYRYGNKTAPVADGAFTMPASDVTVGAEFVRHVVSAARGSVKLTEPAAAADILPDKTEVTFSDGERAELPVTWDIESVGYDPNADGVYTFEGTVSGLPADVLNPDGVKAGFTVEVALKPESPQPGGTSSSGASSGTAPSENTAQGGTSSGDSRTQSPQTGSSSVAPVLAVFLCSLAAGAFAGYTRRGKGRNGGGRGENTR